MRISKCLFDRRGEIAIGLRLQFLHAGLPRLKLRLRGGPSGAQFADRVLLLRLTSRRLALRRASNIEIGF